MLAARQLEFGLDIGPGPWLPAAVLHSVPLPRPRALLMAKSSGHTSSTYELIGYQQLTALSTLFS